MSEAGLCPLCGATWHPEDACRAGCPMSTTCSLVRCPNCGWEAPDTEQSTLVQFFRRLTGGKRKERTHDSH